MNNTYRAIDLIPKDVFICDWHYERAEQTAVYFAMKGFDVATCPWRKPQIALQQVDDMIHFRQHSNPEMSLPFPRNYRDSLVRCRQFPRGLL